MEQSDCAEINNISCGTVSGILTVLQFKKVDVVQVKSIYKYFCSEAWLTYPEYRDALLQKP